MKTTACAPNTPVTKPCAAPAWWPERCAQDPIPSRTRPSNAPAPMVLCLKTRESRSPPGLPSTRRHTNPIPSTQADPTDKTVPHLGAGWSSPVARQAHNLKVAGSNPAPATKHTQQHTQYPSHQAPCLRTGLSVVPKPNTTQQTRKPRFRLPNTTRSGAGEGARRPSRSDRLVALGIRASAVASSASIVSARPRPIFVKAPNCAPKLTASAMTATLDSPPGWMGLASLLASLGRDGVRNRPQVPRVVLPNLESGRRS